MMTTTNTALMKFFYQLTAKPSMVGDEGDAIAEKLNRRDGNFHSHSHSFGNVEPSVISNNFPLPACKELSREAVCRKNSGDCEDAREKGKRAEQRKAEQSKTERNREEEGLMNYEVRHRLMLKECLEQKLIWIGCFQECWNSNASNLEVFFLFTFPFLFILASLELPRLLGMNRGRGSTPL
ncbi:hypothetical protein HZH66_002419 [Vespula vulgaris]|uniref:Uncharacterized protein n=2 Tax=Vespula TaxID=7451 RepID=A0A834NFY3_VESVU|nr:hypothetical protein HZH66_002419 [Vespula vulgaris]